MTTRFAKQRRTRSGTAVAAALLIGVVPFLAAGGQQPASANSVPACGPVNTDDGFHEVSTPPQLTAVARQASGECGLDANYRLMNSIDLQTTSTGAPTPWDPISGTFTGTFDGAGFEISNFALKEGPGASVSETGLFSAVGADGVIAQTQLRNVTLADRAFGFGSVGAFAGTLNGTLSKSSATGEFVVEGGDFGGLAGVLGGAGTIEYSYAAIDISVGGSYESVPVAGGLVAYMNGSIKDSYARGSVVAELDVGGVGGFSVTGSATNVYATGRVTAREAERLQASGTGAPASSP